MDGRPIALGLMSGTSLDGIDAALVVTDGERVTEFGPSLTLPYDETFRERLRARLGGRGDEETARELTLRHGVAARLLLKQAGLRPDQVAVIGFHGHTLLHRPAEGVTVQIGDGALLARKTGIAVVCDFRTRDVAAGGEGAPLVPLYHAALARSLAPNLGLPLAVLNLGGVGNVTWIGEDFRVLAFDTGPGNALIDDWVRTRTGAGWDEGGRLAFSGRADPLALVSLFNDPYFRRRPPKSLDRDHFRAAATSEEMIALSTEDGAATLTGFTAGAVARALEHLPRPPRRWLVCGGGRHNPALMEALGQALECPVEAVEAVGWMGDALEAQAFGFLAQRSLRGLPLSLPETTGVARPMTGGILHRP